MALRTTHLLMRIWYRWIQSVVLLRIASMAWGPTTLIVCPLTLWVEPWLGGLLLMMRSAKHFSSSMRNFRHRLSGSRSRSNATSRRNLSWWSSSPTKSRPWRRSRSRTRRGCKGRWWASFGKCRQVVQHQPILLCLILLTLKTTLNIVSFFSLTFFIWTFYVLSSNN